MKKEGKNEMNESRLACQDGTRTHPNPTEAAPARQAKE